MGGRGDVGFGLYPALAHCLKFKPERKSPAQNLRNSIRVPCFVTASFSWTSSEQLIPSVLVSEKF